MFEIFKGKKNKTGTPVYKLPSGLRVYAVGDIHGRADLLRPLHEAIAQDADKAGPEIKHCVVYLGDYLDRGPYVRETIDELLYRLPAGFRAEYLMGNHEALFLAFLDDPSLLAFWLEIGGHSTLLSYQVQPPGSGFSEERAKAIRQEIIAAMPERHMAFLENLKPYVRMGDVVFVHAGIRPGIPLAQQSPADLFWTRSAFPDALTDHGMRVVHGHTINAEVEEAPGHIGVDTGAYATGILGCAVLEGADFRPLQLFRGEH